MPESKDESSTFSSIVILVLICGSGILIGVEPVLGIIMTIATIAIAILYWNKK